MGIPLHKISPVKNIVILCLVNKAAIYQAEQRTQFAEVKN